MRSRETGPSARNVARSSAIDARRMTSLLLLLLFIVRPVLSTLVSSSLKTCQEQCAERNLAFPLPRGEVSWPPESIAACGYTCSVTSCHIGCHDLDEIASRCSSRCSEDGVMFESCAQGCQAVEQAFLVQVQDLLNTATSTVEPTDEGLRIRWIIADTELPRLQETAATDISWFSQLKSHDNPGWKWSSLGQWAFRNGTTSAEITLTSEKSETIQIRLAAFFRNRVVVTKATSYSLPTSLLPPKIAIKSQLQLANQKVAVCWESIRTQGNFRVTVASLDGNVLQAHDAIANCHLLQKLPSENCCRITITNNLEDGKSVSDSANIEVRHVEDPMISPEDSKENILLFTNGTQILRLIDINDFALSKPPETIPFDVPLEDRISALASISTTDFLVGTNRGSVWRLSLELNDTQIELRPVQEQGGSVTQLVVDTIRGAAYGIVKDVGVLKCKIEEPPECILSAGGDRLNSVKQLALDAVNGFMYFLSADNQVNRISIFASEPGSNEFFADAIVVPGIPPSMSILFDSDNYHLIVALTNGTIIHYDAISGIVAAKRIGEYSEVNHLAVSNERLFWTREKCSDAGTESACFYGEEATEPSPTGERFFGRYLFPGTVLDFIFLSSPLSLFTVNPPEKLSFITTDKEGIITWENSRTMPFSAPHGKWENITYNVVLTPKDGEAVVLVTNTTNQTVAVESGKEYEVKLRSCFEEICSPEILTSHIAFSTLNEQPFVILQKDGEEMKALDILGRSMPIESVLDKGINFDVSRPFAIDNSTWSVFTISQTNSSVIRSPLPPDSLVTSSIFTSYSTVTHLATLSNRATVFMATPYQLLSFRYTGSFDHMFYFCTAPAEECAMIEALSVDNESGEIHFAIRRSAGQLALYEASQEDRTPRLLAEADPFPEIQQFIVFQEKLVFLTNKGEVGYSDKHLKEINYISNIRADALLPIVIGKGTNAGSFPGEISMNNDKKDQLLWEMEPRKNPGKILYKVLLYREKLELGERRVELTTVNHFDLPTDLLESWNSAQRFDVRIEGLTAWTSYFINKTSLQAPVKPPSMPANTTIYATQQKTVDGARAIISFFWEPPAQWNGNPFQYIVNCTKEDGTSQGGSMSSSITHYSFNVKSGKVACQVAASNEPNNIGEFTTVMSIDSSELKPLVRLFAIDATNSLIAITDIGHDVAKREKRQIAQANKMEYQAIAFIGNDLFGVRKEGESVQLSLVQIDTNDIDNVVHKVTIGGDVTRIEAMTSDWVGNRLLLVSGSGLYQLSLDPFLTTSLLNPKKLLSLSTGATDAKQLTFDPFQNIAYLLTKNGSLFSLDLSRQEEQNLALIVPCLTSQTVTWMMTEFAWNKASSPKIYALTWNGLVVVDSDEHNKCNEVRIDWKKFGEKGLKAMSAFAIADKLFVFVTSAEMLIYGRETVVPIPIHNPPLRQILAVSQSSQPYPDRSCFALPSSSGIQFTVTNEGKTGAFLDVQKPPAPTVCPGISLPQTHYEVYFTRKNTDKVKHIRSFSDHIHVENGILDKETDYEVTVAWLNRYSSTHELSDVRPFRTGFGYPSAPRDVNVVSVTPDSVYLYWTLPETLNAPINEIKYKVTQQVSGLSSPSTVAVQEYIDDGFSSSATDAATCLSSPCRIKISNLRPSTDYKFWVTAIHSSHLNVQFIEDSEAISQEAAARTKDVSGTLRPDEVTGSSALLRWNSLQAEYPPNSVSVQYKESGGINDWKAPANASFDPNLPTLLVLINNLLSATTYDYRFVAAYTGSYTISGKTYSYKEDYYQAVQQVKTKAGVPTAPNDVEAHIDEEGWIVSWTKPASDGGSPITSYAVETRINTTAEWEIAERGLDGWKYWWRPAKTNKSEITREFRVRAANAEGFGPYAITAPITIPSSKDEEPSSALFLMLATGIGVVVVLLLIIFCIVQTRRMANLRRKKQLIEDRNAITLAKIGRSTLASSGLSKDTLNELKNIPKVPVDQITLFKDGELGEGSFGKVYRGKVTALPHLGETNVDVAIKTLKPSFKEEERINFLTEAILMNNFDHPNIVRLFAVCLENNPMYLILELMNDGDLLTYLKKRRPSIPDNQPSQLTLKDLLGMMVDVGRGCQYLERCNHVHRDIAARNCLVTTDASGIRITKIADFGLARGTFSATGSFNAHGDNLLPLRWLAPESATRGVFSAKTDIWSYGVLLYELLTLGEQPYPSKTNQKVREHLTRGGCPSRPHYCPDEIFAIMKQCWKYDPNDRPPFAKLLPEIEKIREMQEFQDDKPFPPAFGGHYNEGFDTSQDSTSEEKVDSPIKEQTMFGMNAFNSSMDRGSEIARSNSRHSANRSLRREQRIMEDDAPYLAISSRGSTLDTVSTYDYGNSFTSNQPNRPSFDGYEQPHSRTIFNEERFDPKQLSRSWAAPSEKDTAQQGRSTGSTRSPRIALPSVGIPSHSYSSRQKVSQV